ncbi:MAG: folate family ECF transporter S component [Erysipelotrichaceae bacterium]|nr:folate family ECF transporter S component [Erysipelotrichaceae bacterium]
MKKLTTKDIVLMSLLIGLNVVLSRILSINTWSIKIGFTFLTIYIAAYIYGVTGGVIVAAVGDIIGSLLFPTGPYFPGFTLTSILTGLLFGLLLKRNNDTKIIILTSIINEFIINLLINTFWIHYVSNASYVVLLSTRVFQAIIKCIVEIISIKALVKFMPSFERRIKE